MIDRPKPGQTSRLPKGPGAVLLMAMAIGCGFLACRPSSPPAVPSGRVVADPVTFNEYIAPIVFQNCSSCHRPGEPAPFSLLSFEDVKKHASDVADVTARRFMPPWLPEHGAVEFAGERRLTDDQIALIQRWVTAGAPEGSGNKPAPPTFPQGWQLGTPGLVARMPEPYHLPGEGRDVYRNFVISLGLPSRKYVRAVEFRPGTRVLHHVFMYFDRTRQSRRVDAQDAEVGFGGMALPPSAESPSGYFLSWQPGRGPTHSPPGLAWTLEEDSDLILQAHMQPSGKPEEVQPSIAFYFTDAAPTNAPFKIGLDSYAIDIPAGERSYRLEDSYTLPVDVDVLAVLPHAHFLARQVEGFAVLPDGRKQPLLKISNWDFNWQSDFRFRQPVSLPRGSRLSLQWIYDNSTNNTRNPNQPPRRVRYGLQSSDEMGELYFQVLARTPDDLASLRENYQQHILRDVVAFNMLMLEQNPTNAHAHVQLGKALIALGKPTQGVSHLRRALAITPDEEEGHYNLGVMLMDHDAIGARREFQETVRINPENYKARANLGSLMLAAGELQAAEEQFQLGLKARPGDRLLIDNLNLVQQEIRNPKAGAQTGSGPGHPNR